MYNAAQFLLNGDGGPQDLPGAAAWFKRAAQRDVVDAQYNLGLMYEAGRGVDRNPREALRWFSRTGRAASAASGPQTGPAGPPRVTESPRASVSETQTYLAQQGYYIGPIDGVV